MADWLRSATQWTLVERWVSYIKEGSDAGTFYVAALSVDNLPEVNTV